MYVIIFCPSPHDFHEPDWFIDHLQLIITVTSVTDLSADVYLKISQELVRVLMLWQQN